MSRRDKTGFKKGMLKATILKQLNIYHSSYSISLLIIRQGNKKKNFTIEPSLESPHLKPSNSDGTLFRPSKKFTG